MATSGVTLTFPFSSFAGFSASEDELEPSESESPDPLLSLLAFFFGAFLDKELLRDLGYCSADESESFESEELLSLSAGTAFFFFGATLAELSESLSLLLDDSDELAAFFFFGTTFFLGAGFSSEDSEAESLLLLDGSTTFFFPSVDSFLFLAPALDFDFSEALLALETFEPALALLAGTFGASLLEDESEDPESSEPLGPSSDSEFNSAAFFAASSIAFLAASMARLAFSLAYCFAAFLSN